MKIISSITEITTKEDSFPIFFWDKWKTVEEQLNHKQRLLCVDDEQNVVPFTVYTMSFFKKGDYLYAPLDKEGNRLPVEKEKQFLEEFHKYLKHENLVDVMFPPTHFVFFNSIPTEVIYYKLGLMLVDLTLGEDILFSKAKSNTRNEIRKAESLGVSIQFGNKNIDDFYKCFQFTVNHKNISCPAKSYFIALQEILGENVEMGIAYLNGNIESSEFSVADKKHIYVFYAGTSFTPQYKGSNKYLIWNLFKHSKKTGKEKLIYGGYRYGLTEDDALYHVQKFKKHLGVDVVDGYHFIKVIHPFKYNLVTFALRVKSLLTGRDCSFVNLKGLDVKKSN